jgi:hypothetical protein
MIFCAELAGGKVKGILWYQGCSDTINDRSETYAERFREFVNAARKDLKDSALPFITTQLNSVTTGFPEENDERIDLKWNETRDIQRQIAKQIPNVAIVPALGLPLSDTIHNSASGNLELGARYAQTAMGMVYGKNKNWKYPEIRRAFRIGEKEILLEFDNVNSLIETLNASSKDIFARDEKGRIGIKEVRTVDKTPDSISFILERAPGKELTIGAGEGRKPEISLFDLEEHKPIIAFSGIKVEDLKN